jgi:hypothetical protein
MPMTTPSKVTPELPDTATITEPLPEEETRAAIADVVDLAEDLAIAVQVRARLREDTGERMTLVELIQDQGFEPAEFDVE